MMDGGNIKKSIIANSTADVTPNSRAYPEMLL